METRLTQSRRDAVVLDLEDRLLSSAVSVSGISENFIFGGNRSCTETSSWVWKMPRYDETIATDDLK